MRSLQLFTGLTGLAADLLTGVLDTLAKVRLGRSLFSDLGCDLTDSLLGRTLNDNGVVSV